MAPQGRLGATAGAAGAGAGAGFGIKAGQKQEYCEYQ